MRRIYLLIILFHFSELSSAQDYIGLNGFKYGLIEDIIYEGTPINDLEFKEKISSALSDFGIMPLYKNDIFPDDLKQNPCLGVIITNLFYRGGNGSVPAYFSKLNFVDCRGKIALIIELRHQGNYKGALTKTLSKLKSKDYVFSSELTPKKEFAQVENINITSEELMEYFKNNQLEPIEGVYKTSGYKIGIKKIGDVYKAIIMTSDYSQWKSGDVKIIIEPTAVKEIYSSKYYLNNKKPVEVLAKLNDNVLLKLDPGIGEEVVFLKLFPSENIISLPSSNSNENWKGNGSGFFINEKGYIATNYHVIKDAKAIQVEYFQKGMKYKYAAKVIVSDKQNDLAIIQINDDKFQTLFNIPYVFSFNLKDVGTEVFTLGYPMEDVMGSEIKYTDGKISSKTGWQGDITVYQISVPIQHGNSGGPLFDVTGNLIGITSSGIRPDVAQNANYAIKTTYLKNLIDVMPESITLPNDISIYNKTITDKIKLLSDFIPVIRVK
jgi:S1-C subfamily serine protease